MEENKTIIPEEAVEETVATVEDAAAEVAEETAEAVEKAAEAVEGEEGCDCECECCEDGEEKPAKKNVGKKIGIAATVGTIALGAAAYAAVKIFKRK